MSYRSSKIRKKGRNLSRKSFSNADAEPKIKTHFPLTKRIAKLRKLTEYDDFVNWRRLLKAYLQTKDVALLGLTPGPSNASVSQLWQWNEANVKEKCFTTLTLADDPPAQVRETDDIE